MNAWAALTTHAIVFLVALLFAYATQPLPGGGYRGGDWWRAFRAMFRRRRRHESSGYPGPPIPFHPNCRCIVTPIENAMNDNTKPRTTTPTMPAEQAPAIELTPVESSQLQAYGYDAATGTLAIRFHGHGGKPGSLYHYRNFSETDYAALRDAASKGSHFLRAIKPHPSRYPCTRIIETAIE